jgi:YD repeat-containing protein
MGPGTAPLLSSISRTPKGDASSKDEYLYERAAVKACGLPTRINRYGNPGSLKNYKTLSYFFESNSTFANKYMVSYPSDEKDYNSSGTLLKETQMSYLDYPAGSCGAIDWIKRLKTSGTFLTWDYTYTSSNPNLITITVDLPGNGGTETYEYRYGVLSKIVRPTYTELTRTISQYESSILTETNQHGGTLSFTYDGLSRIKRIDLPSGFNAVTATWATNSVTISQGSNTVVKYWDGMGRDNGPRRIRG